MKRLVILTFTLFIITVSLGFLSFGSQIQPAIAAFNGQINYQGKLTNGSNVAVADGTYNMEFKLYTVSSGGTADWTETRTGGNKVQVTNGVFSVMLGSVTSLSSVDFNQTLYLGVNIGGTGSPSWDGEMTPRKSLGAVPAAFVASNLQGTGVIDITNTGTQQTLNYDGSNRLTVAVANDGFTTLTAVGTGAGFNLTGGNVGIGTTTVSAKLHVTATTEQFRTSYNAGNYTSFTTSSGGDLTIAPSGNDLAVTGNVDVSGTLTAGTANAFNVDASGNVTAGTWQGTIITSAYGGTGNGFTKFTGPATSEKTFTLPNASATILTTNSAVTPAQGGTGFATYTLGDLLYSDASNSLAKLSGNTTTTRKFLRQTGNGSISAAPAWDTLTSADVGLGNVENTALSTWAGTTNITTLGTITTGTWSGSTVQVNKGGTGTTDGSITGSGALTFTGTGGNLLLRTTTSGDVNFQPASFIANVGGGTSRTALRFLEPSGTGSDYAAIQSNANVTTSYTWTLPAADASGCIQSNGSGALSISACGGGSQTPWDSDIDAASYNLFGLSNLLFGETAAAPASSDIAVYSTGSNLILNTPSGKSLLITNDGSTEYNFSPSALSMNSNNIIGLGTAVTGSGAVTITGTSGDLSLVTATSGNVNLNSAGGTIELQDATNVTGALDVSTTLAVGTANAFQVDATGAVTAVTGITMTSGNFLQNGTGTFGTGTGAVSLNGDTTIAAGKSLTLTAGVGTIAQNFQPLGTTATAKGLTVTPLFTLNATDQTLSSIYINPNTNSNNDTGDVLYGLNIDNITASSATETAIRVGTGWDTAISTAGNYVQTSANTTQTTTSSAMVLNLNSLSSGTGLYAASSTISNGKLVDLQSTSANSEDGQVILNISATGTAIDSINTMYGAKISNTISDSFIQSTNVALYLNASGGGVANYGLIVNAGSVGFGTTAPDKALEVNSSNGNNLRLTYGDSNGSATNYADLLMSSGGDLTIAPSGSDTAITGNLDVSGTIFAGTANAFQVSSSGTVTAVGVNAGAGLIQGTLGLTVSGATASINSTGTSATNIGNSTGVLTVASGGASSWTNTSGGLTISTATSGTLAVTSAAVLNLTSGGTSALNLDSASGTVVIATGDALQTSIAGSPVTLADGQIWYDSTAGKYKIREGAATKILCNTTDAGCGAGGSTAWDTIADPSGNGAINMGTTVQTLDWGSTTTADNLTVTSSATGLTSGSAFKVTSATTGAVTNGIVQLLGSANFSGSGGLLNVTANSTTAGVVAKFSGTALTTGTGVTITGGTAMTTGTVLASSATYNHASAETGSLQSITVTDNSSASSGTTTTNGSQIAVTASSDNSGGTAIVNGLSVATTIDTTGAGTKQINALNIDAPTVTACTSGACTFKGLNITGGTGSSANVTSYGAYIDAGTGSGTEYAAAFMNGNVGIGTDAPLSMLQIGAAANRGDITVYGDLKVIGADIQRTLSGIIDIFVYDTARDSDGGEWRNSLISQQMSWATETKDDGPGDACVISSDDRCGTSVFPRKAILVTTADALYIFDGSDNSLWMKFTQAGTYALGADSNNNPSGVGAQNGVVVVGTNGSSGTGMYAIDFKQDVIYRYNTTDRRQADINIGNRNSTATYSDNAETGFAILDNIVNDVSIAVQSTSNEGSAGTLIAPIDSQGGPLRGVTIIAAANDSGVSVINMGTRKVINYSDATNNDYNQVVMTSRGRMYATNETLAQLEEWKGVDTVSTTQANGTPTRVYDETISKTPLTTGTAPTISTNPSALAVIERASSARESAAAGQTDSGDIVFVGTNQGLAEIHTSGGTLAAASWSKLTTTTVATPYMVGAAKAAFTFEEAAGSTAANSVIGTGANNARLDQAGATAPTFGGGGVRGNSVNFNNNSYLCSDANDDGTCDFDSLFNSSTTSFTVSLWFKHSVTAASDTLFERCYTPATPTVAVGCIWAGMTSTGTIKIGLDSITTWTYETTYDDSVTSAATYNDNQWHHLVYTNTDTDICLYIDGRQAAACDTSLAATATLDASQVLTVGGACSGANCTTGTNFWDGSIDDMVWSSGGGTTADGLTAQSANKLYLDGRAHMIRPNATVTDATTTSSTTIGDSGESYVPDSFVGLVVELTGGTGSGQTRTIISNTATTFTVYPAFTITPDTTTDYQVSPAKLYGSSNNVTAISVDSPTQLNKVRRVYVGTNDGADGGGVTVYTNAGAGSIKTEVIHADAGYVNDDLGSSWSGTGSDNITAIGSYSETLAIGTGAFLRVKRNDTSLKQLQGDTISAIEDIRQALVAMGLFGATQDVLGLGQGADLAEYYHSTEVLDYGDVVAIDPNSDGDDVIKTNKPYASNVLGVVSTRPGVTLGNYSESGYPIALKGRIPVKFSDENGPVKTGDYLTTSTIPGYAMRATGKGIVIGKALADSPLVENMNYCSMPNDHTPSDESPTSDSEEQGPHCGMVTMFVEQGEHSGISVEDLITQMELAISDDSLNKLPGEDSVLFENGEYKNDSTKQDKILAFLKQMREQKEAEGVSSQIITDRLSATFEVITPNLVADGLEVLTIGTEGRGINMLADLTFIGRPYFNSDTAGFAKILQGDRYVDIAFERPYLEQPTVIVNITQEQDNQILEEINQQAIDTMRVIDDANVELLFGSDIQYLVTRKNQNGFRIILSKPAPQDIIFSWVALAVKQPRLVISDGLGAGDYIPAIVEEQTIFDDNNYEDSGVVAGDNSSSSEEEALGSDDTSSTEDQSTTDDTVQPDSLNSSEGSPPSDSAAGTGLE